MGGVVCAIHKNAVLRFESVPVMAHELVQFDAQIRELYNAPTIAESIATETDKGQTVCDILAKEHFSQTDRQTLLDVVESLYEL